MKTSFFALVLTFFCFSLTYSQLRPASDLAGGYNFSVPEVYHSERIKTEFFKEIAKDLKIDVKDIKGSPYQTETFIPGKIVDDLTKQYSDVFLRYNIYNDVFEVKNTSSSEEIFGFIKASGYHAEIKGNKYYYKVFTNEKKKIKEGYLQELFQVDDLVIFKRSYQKLHLTKPAKTSLEQDIPARLSNLYSYFLENNKKLELIDMHKNKIVNAFPKHKSELKNFIKKERLRFKEEKDLIKLLTYYNSLIAN